MVTILNVADETLRLKWTRLVEWVLRSTDQIDTRALYPGTIIISDGNKASVKPDDERLGLQLANKPVRRPDGYTAIPTPGVRCLIGWDGYREDSCFILLGFDGNGATNSINLQAINSITHDAPVTTATHDLVSEHELGSIVTPLQVTAAAPVVFGTTVSGDDTSFDLTFDIADMQSLAPGDLIATVTLGRVFSSAPRAIVSAKSTSWGTSPASFAANNSGNQQIQIYWTGTSLAGPRSNLTVTVFVRGTK